MTDYPYGTDPIISILLDCLHRDAARFPASQLSGMDRQQWNQLSDLATEHRVVPLLYRRLISTGNARIETDASLPSLEFMRTYSRQVSKNNLRFYGELQRFLEKLNEYEIPVILLKGIYLAEHVYENRGLREMNDMDLLFKKRDLEAAFRILCSLGYEPLKPIEVNKISYHTKISVHLPRMIKQDAAGFEIHWNIVKPGKPVSIDPDGLWERAVTLSFMDHEVMALAPADLLLHLCVHNAYDHMFSFGLRPFCDLTAVIDRFGDQLDWDTVCSRAAEYEWTRGVMLSLMIAKDFLGADVPSQVLKKMQPDDFNPLLADIARKQILTKKEASREVATHMVNFASADGLCGKARTVFSRIFLPKDQMIAKYPVRPGSPLLIFWYLFRIVQMTGRHTAKVLRVTRGDPQLSGIIERKEALQAWMNGEGVEI